MSWDAAGGDGGGGGVPAASHLVSSASGLTAIHGQIAASLLCVWINLVFS